MKYALVRFERDPDGDMYAPEVTAFSENQERLVDSARKWAKLDGARHVERYEVWQLVESFECREITKS